MISSYFFFRKNVINSIKDLNIKTNNLKVLDVGSSSISLLERLGLPFKKLTLFDIKFIKLKKKKYNLYKR